jgi:hypothetical protein
MSLLAPLSTRAHKKGDVWLTGKAPPERGFHRNEGRLSLDKVIAEQDLRISNVRD